MSKVVDFPGSNQDQASKELPESMSAFVSCSKCGGFRFIDAYLLRKVTPIEDPNLLETAIVPILLYQCTNCGKMVNPNEHLTNG